MNMRSQVIQEARAWLGTPYHHLAAVKGAGVDCAMLLVRIYQAVGLVPADLDPRPYAPDWHLHRSEEKFLGWLERHATPVATPQPGDVAVWRYGRTYSHGAVVVDGWGQIIHAYQDAGSVVLGNLKESTLAQRPVLFWQVHGIEGAV